MKNKIRVGFIGCGHIARAMIDSMLDIGAAAAMKANGDVLELFVADRNESKLLPLRNSCHIFWSIAEAAARADYVFLCVKPQDAEATTAALELKDKTVISVMAGVSIARLKALTGASRIVRVMPNLNARVGESFSAYATEGMDNKGIETVEKLLGCFGKFKRIPEDKFDSVTGLTGSAPAFVFKVIKALTDEGVAQGFDAATAKEMAIQTVLGSALTAERENDLAALVASVCSKGGTTIEGVTHLDDKAFETTLREAVVRSINRSKELSK